MPDRSAVSRRRLLELLSASSLGGLAGCGGQTGTPEGTVTEAITATQKLSATRTDTTTETPSETATAASFDIRNVQYPKTISEGAKIEVRFEIVNEGEQGGRTTVFVRIHEFELSREIELEPGGLETLSFEFELTTPPGSYDLVVFEAGTGETVRTPIQVEKRVMDLPWTQLPGPPGGPVNHISISQADPDWIYTTTITAGVYASPNGGESWIQGFSGMHHRPRIWASPFDPEHAFTSLEWTGNGGKVWHRPEWSDEKRHAPGAGQVASTAYDLEWDPFNRDVIYAATDQGLVRSENGGRTWERDPITGEPEFGHLGFKIAAHPNREGVIVAGVANKVAKTTDGGEHWTILDLEDGYSWTREKHARDIRFINQDSESLYLALGKAGVYKLVNDDLQDITADLPDLVFPKPFSFGLNANAGKLYFVAGESSQLYPMEDWWDDRKLYVYDANSDKIGTIDLPEKPSAVTTHPNDPETLYVGGVSWIHESNDGGQTWEKLSNGFVDHYLSTVAVNPSHPETVLPGSVCSTGLSVSHDRGKTYEWKRSGLDPWHPGVFSEHYIKHIEGLEERIYATTRAGLLISEDNGETWRMLENRFSGKGTGEEPDTHLYGLAVHPADPNTVYVGTGLSGHGPQDRDAFDGAFIWKTTDGGETWDQRTDGFPSDANTSVQDIVINPHSPDVVYAATFPSSFPADSGGPGVGMGLYRSTDAGRSWDRLPSPSDNVYSISVDARDRDTLYLSTPPAYPGQMDPLIGRAHRSTDGGESWERMLKYQTYALSAHPTEPGVLFSGSMKYRDYWDVLVSDDGGESWYESGLRIRASTDPAGPDLEYEAAELHSDYWGSASGQIMWFALDGANSLLYAATNGVGLWRCDVDALVG